jgi:hypothetical protein
MIKFCAREECHDVAVGVSRWDPKIRPEDRYCRTHYVEDVMGEPVLAEVVGVCEVTDSITQTGVGLGGTVRLDPRQVNIAQLVYAGHVRVQQPGKPGKPGKSTAAAGDTTGG